MNNYLDKQGMVYFWNKIKTFVGSKQDKAKTTTGVLTTAGWTSDSTTGLYTQNITVSFITSSTPIVIVDVSLTGDADADSAVLEAWAGPSSQKTDQGNGYIKFYTAEIPEVNIPIKVGVLV